MDFDRYIEILAQHNLTPFYREPWVNPRTWRIEPMVLGERPAMHWRVSPDEWDRLLVHVEPIAGEGNRASPTMAATLLGWPVAPDESLPPNSVVFERDAAERMGRA